MKDLVEVLFVEPFAAFEWGRKFPALDVCEKDDKIVVKAEIPGMDKKVIHVRVEDDKLSISGEKRSEKKDEKDNYTVLRGLSVSSRGR